MKATLPIGVRAWFDLYSYDRMIQTNICEKILFFANKEKYHAFFARTTHELMQKGYLFNESNIKRYFEYSHEILPTDCVEYLYKANNGKLQMTE